MFDVPINEKSDRIYDAIRKNTILPLKLPRRLSPTIDRNKSPDRLPYPLMTNFVEFQEYRRQDFWKFKSLMHVVYRKFSYFRISLSTTTHEKLPTHRRPSVLKTKAHIYE